MDIDIEILPCAEAPWAPKVHCGDFTWAWRIRRGHVNQVTGVCSGPRRYAERMAKHAAARMKNIVTGTDDDRFSTSIWKRCKREPTWTRRNSGRAGPQ